MSNPRLSFGLWKDHSSLVRYNTTVVVGSSSVPTTVTIQALDVNGNTLQTQSNLLVRLTTGVLPYVDSTNGTLAVATGTVVAEDLHTVTSTIAINTRLKLQSSAAGLWSFTVTNATVAQLMGLVIGPCEGCFRADFSGAFLTQTVAGVTTTSTVNGGVALTTFKHAS